MDQTKSKPRRWPFGRRRGEHEERALTRSDLPRSMMLGTVAGEPVSVRGALALSDAWACVRVLANAASQCPPHLYRRTGRSRSEASGATGDLLRVPAPGMPGATFTAQVITHMCLWGECFIGKFREGGSIVQLGLLAPDAVTVDIVNGERFYDYTDPNGNRQRLTRRDVVHCMGMSLDGVRGLSPVAQAREGLGLNSALAQHGSATFANGARLSGLLRVPAGPQGEEMATNLQRAWGQNYSGPTAAAKTAVVTGEVEFQSVSMSPADAEFLATRELSTREVCRIFSVPPSLVAAESGGSMTYSTVALEMQALQRLGVGPILNYVSAALSQDPDLCGPAEYIAYSYEGLLRADENTRSAFYNAGITGGWLVPNEIRAWEDLEPLPGGDQPRPSTIPPPTRVAADA